MLQASLRKALIDSRHNINTLLLFGTKTSMQNISFTEKHLLHLKYMNRILNNKVISLQWMQYYHSFRKYGVLNSKKT